MKKLPLIFIFFSLLCFFILPKISLAYSENYTLSVNKEPSSEAFFYLDGTLITRTYSNSYTYNLSEGTHTLDVKLRDVADNYSWPIHRVVTITPPSEYSPTEEENNGGEKKTPSEETKTETEKKTEPNQETKDKSSATQEEKSGGNTEGGTINSKGFKTNVEAYIAPLNEKKGNNLISILNNFIKKIPSLSSLVWLYGLAFIFSGGIIFGFLKYRKKSLKKKDFLKKSAKFDAFH